MKQFIAKNKKALAGLGAALVIGGATMSFQDSGFLSQKFNDHDVTDTVPDRRHDGHMTMKEFDKMQENLDNVLLKAGQELKKINFDDIEKTIESSLKAVDIDNLMATVEKSLKDIDVEKIVADATASLKNIDWDEHSAEIKKALSEAKIEMDKARDEIKKIDKDEIKKELEQAKKEMEKSKIEFRNVDMDKIMKEAQEGIDKAKIELKQIKTMFNEMEKDGLVNAKDGFTIEYKDKSLYINGKQQSDQVTNKYKQYISDDHFKITIDKEK